MVGSGTVVAALDEAVQYTKEVRVTQNNFQSFVYNVFTAVKIFTFQGGILQVIVPAELGYPVGDSEHDIVGPK